MDISEVPQNASFNSHHGESLHDYNDSSTFSQEKGVKKPRPSSAVLCFLQKIVIEGADRVLKDRKFVKLNCFANDLEHPLLSPDGHREFPSQNAEIWTSASSMNVHPGDRENASITERKRLGFGLKENEKLLSKHNQLLCSETPKPCRNGCIRNRSGHVNINPLNSLITSAGRLIKLAIFQLRSMSRLFSLPLWLTYYFFMLFLFPSQTLSRVREHLIEKIVRMTELTITGIGMLIAQSLMGGKRNLPRVLRIIWALFTSIYVFLVLLGMLILGFVVGGTMVKSFVEKPVHISQYLNFNYAQPNPVAFVLLTSSSFISGFSSLHPSGNVEPISKHGIPSNQRLQLGVSLSMPESDHNRKVGMFQVRVEFLSATGSVVASSSHPCILRLPIQVAETILKAPPLLAGYLSESQQISIEMDGLVGGVEPIACLKVILEPRADHRPGSGIPEIYFAWLKLEAELPYLKMVIWGWWRTIFVWLSMSSFVAELVFVLLFCRVILCPRTRRIFAADKQLPSRYSFL